MPTYLELYKEFGSHKEATVLIFHIVYKLLELRNITRLNFLTSENHDCVSELIEFIEKKEIEYGELEKMIELVITKEKERYEEKGLEKAIKEAEQMLKYIKNYYENKA
jgi:hypothetical protein